MPNEENTQQLPNANGQNQSLEARVTTLEEIILARLNDTRPFEKQLLAALNEMNDKFDRLSGEVNRLSGEVIRLSGEVNRLSGEVAELRTEFNQFREETNKNFQLVNEKLEFLNNSFLDVRARHNLLEKRVARLEEQAV